MKYTILLTLFLFTCLYRVEAQQQPERTRLRIVDTLTKQERANRNPVILKAELDSLVQQYAASLPQDKPQEPVKEVINKIPSWVTAAGLGALAVIAILLYLIFSYHKRLNGTMSDLKRLIQNFGFYSAGSAATGPGGSPPKNKTTMEKKINELNAELDKQKRLYQATVQEYEWVKKAIAEVYKVRNYPLYNREKSEAQVIVDLLATERTVAAHAFEKFMKPLIVITDQNKNNPARISKEDSEKLLELLVSLSLYYIEYLYLRINDLSVGGNMVQRIGSNGNGIDPALLKKLNTEHGSRALALRMALNRSGVGKLTYPVFDETDLNNF